MDETKLVLNSLKPLFETAEKEGLWFHQIYQDMWFSPKELRKYHAIRKYVWGPANWALISPYEKLRDLEKKRANIDISIKEFRTRI
ncbi:MAG: hypothetical protein P4L59_07970 [Desulfosporosinus sp.]|nr:hypothetical protein [Desulfosporosinus sp.]